MSPFHFHVFATLFAGSLLLGVTSAKPSPAKFECPAGSEDLLFPHNTKCYLYYDCLDSKAYLIGCPYPLVFDQVKQSCQMVTDCGDRQLWGVSGEGGEEVGDFKCPEPNGIFPNEKYCWKYWNCGNNISYPMECPENYHFDIPHKYCDYPDRVDCKDREPRPENNQTTKTTTTTTESGISELSTKTSTWANSTSTTQSPPDFECPSPSGQFAHEKYCWKYWDCWDSVPTLGECRDDLLFDDMKKYCDYPDRVECGHREPRPQGYKSKPSKSLKSKPKHAKGKAEATTWQPPSEFECPEPSGYFPNPDDCESYYTCANSISWYEECPPDQQFDPESNVCDWEYNVNCKETSGGLVYQTVAPETPKPTPDSGFSCPRPEGNFEYPDDCHYYYHCEGGSATLFWCGEDYFFDPEVGYCSPGDCVKGIRLIKLAPHRKH